MRKMPVANTAAKNTERGAILVVVLVLVFAVTLALLAYLYLNKNNTLIASNLAVQNAAQEASDQGLQNASGWLNGLTNWPEILATQSSTALSPKFFLTMPSSGYLNSGVTASTASTAPVQAPTNPSFWTNCVANDTCYSIGTVAYGPFNFQVEYVIFPTGGLATQQNGSEQTQTGNTNGAMQARYYAVFVHVMRSNGGGLGVTVQSVIRKVMAS
ncbi:hypothetical protein [Acidithiobacillus sp. IBUN Pt1247-S3]|uniref:hypothetical protein n=1 Tax=Acidithiobacillus sp. IBUN Pt1247-S3 TaxID=3166642 RepID=UPI0034E536A8